MIDTHAHLSSRFSEEIKIEGLDYVIPANDDAIKGVKLLLDYVVAAVLEGAADKKEEATTKK